MSIHPTAPSAADSRTSSRLSSHAVQAQWLAKFASFGIRDASLVAEFKFISDWGLNDLGAMTDTQSRDRLVMAILTEEAVSLVCATPD